MENFNSTFVAELVTHLADNATSELSHLPTYSACMRYQQFYSV